MYRWHFLAKRLYYQEAMIWLYPIFLSLWFYGVEGLGSFFSQNLQLMDLARLVDQLVPGTNLPVSTPLILKLILKAHMSMTCSRDQNSDSHVCMTDSLSTEPFPKPYFKPFKASKEKNKINHLRWTFCFHLIPFRQ